MLDLSPQAHLSGALSAPAMRPLAGRTVALLEARRSRELAALVEHRGGRPRLVPAMREADVVDRTALAALVGSLVRAALDVAIFQTGVGTAALLRHVAAMCPTAEAALRASLELATVVVRGPKPTAVLRGAGIRIDRSAASPFTTAEVLAQLDGLQLRGRRVLVQHYGGPNARLVDYLLSRGAAPLEIVLYRWTLPENTAPLLELLNELRGGAVDAVMFTSASQVHNLVAVADQIGRADELREGLERRTVVAAVGPVCAAALAEHDVRPPGGIVLPPNPKMGPLVNALAEHFAPSPA